MSAVICEMITAEPDKPLCIPLELETDAPLHGSW